MIVATVMVPTLVTPPPPPPPRPINNGRNAPVRIELEKLFPLLLLHGKVDANDPVGCTDLFKGDGDLHAVGGISGVDVDHFRSDPCSSLAVAYDNDLDWSVNQGREKRSQWRCSDSAWVLDFLLIGLALSRVAKLRSVAAHTPRS